MTAKPKPASTVAVPDAPKHRFLTVDQVAEELNVSSVQVRALIKSGELRAIQVGGRGMWRIGVQDVEDYIAEAYRVTAQRIAAGELKPADDEEPRRAEESGV